MRVNEGNRRRDFVDMGWEYNYMGIIWENRLHQGKALEGYLLSI